MHALIRMAATTVLFATCLLLAHFFSRRWTDPVFRVFTIFFGVSSLLYFGILMTSTVLEWSSPEFVQWRASVFLVSQAVILVYLAWTLRPRDL
jgi:hypothetical protein